MPDHCHLINVTMTSCSKLNRRIAQNVGPGQNKNDCGQFAHELVLLYATSCRHSTGEAISNEQSEDEVDEFLINNP